jgi:uncharacterized protein YhbP (UPF0306 family)
MDIKKLTKDYMTSIKHMQLATTNNSQPWLCTVYFVNDDNFCLYWASRRSRQHSLEILKSSKAAITIVKDTENKQALQIIGNAYEVEENDLVRVHELYTSKFGPNDYNLD